MIHFDYVSNGEHCFAIGSCDGQLLKMLLENIQLRNLEIGHLVSRVVNDTW